MYPLALLAMVLLAMAPEFASAQGPARPEPMVAKPAGTETLSLRAPQPAGAALTAEDANAWLDGFMPYALKTGDIAGAVVVIVKDGQILTERGYGYADVARRNPVDPKLTLFRPGSVAKLITWTAVMQQVELGKIALDADINGYLDFKIPARDGQPITMRNLMQHTPGFEEYGKDGITIDPRQAVSFETWLKQWIPERIFPPGTTPAYSNYGATLAGYIVQRVSGEPFDVYLERHIFAPLDMRHSTFRQPLPANLAPLMSQGYALGSGDPQGFEIVAPAPAGSMSATGEDLAHFMIAHLQGGTYHGNRILQPETAQMMRNSPLTLLPPLNRMELGFFETHINGREVIGHFGDTQFFHTSLHLFLKEGAGFYVSFNSLGKGGAAGALRTALFEDFADRYFPGNRRDGRVDAQTAAEHARMMAGRWVLSRRSESNFLNATELIGQMKLGVGAQGKLAMPIPGLNGQPRDWIEIAPFVWRDSGSHQLLAAKVVGGKAVRFSLDLVAPFMVWDRAPWHKNTAWLLPLFLAAVAALALTAVLWPIAAIVRRRYGATLALEPRALRAFRLSRIAALAIILALAAWATALALLSSDLKYQNASFSPVLWLVEIFGAVALIGGFALLLWNLRMVWSGARRWPAKTWSVVLALAALVTLWVGIAFKLVSFGVNY